MFGGGTNVTDCGSLNLSISFTMSAARDLLVFSLGQIPTTAISEFGYLVETWFVNSIISFAMYLQLLWPLRRSLEPMETTTFLGLQGKPPCIARHATCRDLSPPIPRFFHPGSFDLKRWMRERRDKRSTDESPIMQFTGLGFNPRQQWLSYLSPHVRCGLDLFTWENERGEGQELS